MLIGPRMREGEQGYMVVTPLEREGGEGTKVLVNRGWISKKLADQKLRPESLVKGEVRVEGMLREPWKKNMFTPENRPERGEFYFPDVRQMAELTGSQAVWVEQTMGMCSRYLDPSPPLCGSIICRAGLTTRTLQSPTFSQSMTMRPRASLSGSRPRSTSATTTPSTSSPGMFLAIFLGVLMSGSERRAGQTTIQRRLLRALLADPSLGMASLWPRR